LKIWIVLLALALAFMHQDFWYWDDPGLVFGVMPVGLFYHAMYSVVVSLFWWWVVRTAWPLDLDEPDDEVVS
jgi:hypothetical protein